MKAQKIAEGHVLTVDMGEEFISSIQKFASMQGYRSGAFSGIGALRDVELGYYWLDRKEYKRQRFPEIVELVCATGNVALKDGAPFVHCHVALGREDYSLFGGHLFSGIVAVTAEVVFRPINVEVVRRYDERAGLFLLDLPFCKAL